MKLQIEVSNAEDRRTIAAILIANGYTVRQVKVKGSRIKTNIEAIKEEKEESDGTKTERL